MIKIKVCMLRSFAVDNTSLVQQYVNSIFNKVNLLDNWTIHHFMHEQLDKDGWNILQTSAKDSDNVEAAYLALAR